MCILTKSAASLLAVVSVGALTVGSNLFTSSAHADPAFSFTSDGQNYFQNFDGMGATGTSYITGFTAVEASGTGTNPGVGNTLTLMVGTGSGSAGAIYNVGASGSTDRAFGSLASGTIVPAFGASFLNSTGGTVTGLDLAGVMEQWRGSSSVLDDDVFQYSLDATSLTTGDWTTVSAFDLMAVITPSSTNNVAADGNLPANQSNISAMLTSLNWAPGQTLWIRWSDNNDTGSDGLLAIDNLSLTVHLGAAPRNLIYNGGGTFDSVNMNFLKDGTATTFVSGDVVTFDDTGISSPTVAIDPNGVSTNGVNVSNNSGTYTFTGGAITGSGGLTKTNNGVLILSNTGNSYTGATVVSGGELRSGADDVIPDNSSVTVNTGGLLNINGHIETVGNLNINGGTVQVGLGNLTTGLVTLTGGTLTSASPGEIDINANLNSNASSTTSVVGGIINFGGVHTITTADGAAAVDLMISAAMEASGRITFAGEGTVELGGNNSGVSVGFTINAPSTGQHGPILILDTDNALGSGTFFFNGGTLTASAPVNIPAIFSLGGNVTFSGADMVLSGAFSSFGTTAKVMTVNNNLTISVPITAGTASGTATPEDFLRKAGTGKLTLTAANSYVDGTVLLQGTLEADNDSALSIGPVSLAPATGTSATLIFGSNNPVIASLATTDVGTSTILLGGVQGDTVLTVGNSTSTTFAGSIQNSAGHLGSIVKVGTGTLTLTGASTYTGTTTVTGGTLLVSGSISGTSGVTIGDSSGVASGATLAGAGTISGTGPFQVMKNGTVAPGDSNSPTGTLSITDSVTFDGNLNVDLHATATGGSSVNAGLDDEINLTGTFTLGPDATLTGDLLSGYVTNLDDLFFIVVNDGADAISGQFLNAPQGSTVTFGNEAFTISYSGDATSNSFTGGNDIVLKATTAIPEPGSTFLMLISLSSMCGLGRFRRQPSRLSLPGAQ